VRNAGSKALQVNVTVRNKSSKALSSSFWVTHGSYKVERINYHLIQKEHGPASIATVDTYTTVLIDDVEGYTSITAIVAAGGVNDIQYRIQGVTRFLPSVWSVCRNQAGTAINDLDLTASDPEAAGIAETIKGEYMQIRIQAKNKNAGLSSRAWATIRASSGS
jgi:hypothetical protein